MSAFLKVIKRHEAEIDRMIAEQEGGNSIPYSVMRDNGMLKPFAVRLPVPLIAVLDEMVKHGLWESKQEMAHDMIQSAYADFYSTLSAEAKTKFDQIQNKAWEDWQLKNKDKLENIAIGTLFNRSVRVPKKNKRVRK